MSKELIRIEVMTEILSEAGVSATPEQIKNITEDFAYHIEMEREMDSYQHIGGKEECRQCKSLEGKIKELEKETEVFRNSVKQRRHAQRVWIEGDSVMYE